MEREVSLYEACLETLAGGAVPFVNVEEDGVRLTQLQPIDPVSLATVYNPDPQVRWNFLVTTSIAIGVRHSRERSGG